MFFLTSLNFVFKAEETGTKRKLKRSGRRGNAAPWWTKSLLQFAEVDNTKFLECLFVCFSVFVWKCL